MSTPYQLVAYQELETADLAEPHLTRLNQTVRTMYGAIKAANNRVTAIENSSTSAQVSTGNIDPGATVAVTVQFTTSLANNKYAVGYGVEDTTGSLQVISFYRLTSPGSGVKVFVKNISSVQAKGILNVTAVLL